MFVHRLIVIFFNRPMTDLYSHELVKNQGIVEVFLTNDQVITRVAFIGDRESAVYAKIFRQNKNFFEVFLKKLTAFALRC